MRRCQIPPDLVLSRSPRGSRRAATEYQARRPPPPGSLAAWARHAGGGRPGLAGWTSASLADSRCGGVATADAGAGGDFARRSTPPSVATPRALSCATSARGRWLVEDDSVRSAASTTPNTSGERSRHRCSGSRWTASTSLTLWSTTSRLTPCGERGERARTPGPAPRARTTGRGRGPNPLSSRGAMRSVEVSTPRA